MKRISIVTLASLASALVLMQSAHAGLLGAGGLGGTFGGNLAGNLGGQTGPGALGGQLGIDGRADGQLARPDTTRATGALDKAQGQTQSQAQAQARELDKAQSQGQAQARDITSRTSGELRGSAANATRSADGALTTSGQADVTRGATSTQVNGTAAATLRH